MKITVNNTPLEIHEGAKVQDAILKYYSSAGKKVPCRSLLSKIVMEMKLHPTES